MTPQQRIYAESRYGGFAHIDGSVAFYTRINALIQPEFRVLDIGCGRGCFAEGGNPYKIQLRNMRGKVKEVVGIDVSNVCAENKSLDRFARIDGPRWPVEADVFDLAFSDSVVEHLTDVDLYFAEAFRVLKNGGVLCLRTPNVWGYVGVISRLIPNRLHAKVLNRAQSSRKEEDVFPTTYKCNTRGKLHAAMQRAGFVDTVVVGHESDPQYLSFSGAAYTLGAAYQKLVPGAFANTLFAYARKP